MFPYISAMFLRKIFLCFLFVIGISGSVHAQQDEVCDAINAIVRDAPNQFRNVRGDAVKSRIWACSIQVPGTISSRFVGSMGLFYEGAVLQTKNKDDVKAVYDKYKAILKDCFSAQGYKMITEDNFYPGLEAYKKLAFMPPAKDDQKSSDMPAHAAIEVTYSKQVGYYTVVLYIFEH